MSNISEINKDTFWELIAQAKEQCGQDQDAFCQWVEDRLIVSAPMRFCSFSPNRICRKMAGNGVQPLHNYTCRFRPSSLKQADKSGLDGLQTGKSDSG